MTISLREELILRPARVVPQRSKNGCRAVVHHGQHPLDVRPFIDIGHHGGNARACLRNCACDIHLECKNTHSVQPVAVIPERLVHPAVPHEAPHHAPLSLQVIPHRHFPPLKMGRKKAPEIQTLFIFPCWLLLVANFFIKYRHKICPLVP